MRKYQFPLVCRPRRDLRECQVYEFIRLTEEAFGIRSWEYDGRRVRLDQAAVTALLMDEWANKEGDDHSIILQLWSVEGGYIDLHAVVGSPSWMYDEFRVDFSRIQ